ncbi:G patch domain-containing protein 4 [Archocentrus centrarchus]|uniref:G patch domain-containing protein 4 n=1 Tax=Archocentrus centrarchus TaxID=63155 RepID=UPI0011EA153C|nr:G patch domain-containing protein 4 [Archocentrus centrarchus]XP_030606676.1 G patch domain-containing protein 4 [Archocentrus centrarchus]
MAEAVPEKSRGLKFAEQQLLRHGWEHGKGLGRAENGISEAIKVKVKCDKGGVGHKEGEQFSFHWWDHVFNKASSSLQVESDQNGIKLKKTAEEEGGMISNKKPRKATLAKDKLYGCFVKSATLLSGQERPEPKASGSDDSSSSSDEDDDRRMDLSSTTKLSDADLMKACGGRTAHKGARHGLTMSAKLARLEQQEAEFMAKYGKKSQTGNASPVCATPTPPTCYSQKQEEMMENRKMKINEQNGEVSETPETAVQPEKKKKPSDDAEGLMPSENCEADGSRKHKKKKKNKETLSAAVTAELHTDKVKKKKSKHRVEEEASDSKESSQSNHTGLQEAELTESTVRKRKKCKKDKISADEEVVPTKRKKKKCKD